MCHMINAEINGKIFWPWCSTMYEVVNASLMHLFFLPLSSTTNPQNLRKIFVATLFQGDYWWSASWWCWHLCSLWYKNIWLAHVLDKVWKLFRQTKLGLFQCNFHSCFCFFFKSKTFRRKKWNGIQKDLDVKLIFNFLFR